ncbi:MAG: hypothetical protein J6Z27_02405 [Bacteroidales bacterium]|nr:hypothetical protein [Bacteroidales bacterium]
MYRDLASYYLRWYHEKPMVICSSRRDELRTLHTILMKCISHFISHWRDYLQLGEKETAILEEQSLFPFRAGTFRPDYLVEQDNSLRLCEITSRFFAHGIFMSQFSHLFAERFMSRFPNEIWEDSFDRMMDKMLAITEGRKRIFVFKSADKTGEIALYKKFYEGHGYTVTILETAEIEASSDDWAQSDAFLISALNQKDILSLSEKTLRKMMERGMYSDFRNIFLIHDKRFLSLWFNDRFTGECLTENETLFLRQHSIPTFTCEDSPETVKKALEDKNGYIVKPAILGKSEGVYAGPLTDDATWRKVLSEAEGYVIQPFITQKKYPTVWEGTLYEDYICGMMLCVDDLYYDSGFFRASSLPVTNIGDDRKIAVIHSDSSAILPYCDTL